MFKFFKYFIQLYTFPTSVESQILDIAFLKKTILFFIFQMIVNSKSHYY